MTANPRKAGACFIYRPCADGALQLVEVVTPTDVQDPKWRDFTVSKPGPKKGSRAKPPPEVTAQPSSGQAFDYTASPVASSPQVFGLAMRRFTEYHE